MNLDKKINIKKIKNIGVIAHIDAGKTTFTERFLFLSGAIANIGEVHQGTTVTDWLEEERKRGITIVSSAVSTIYKQHQINVIDTPGHSDFKIEVERCLCTLDSVVVVICAVGGIQSQTETVWRESIKHKIPKIIFINKVDRGGVNFDKVLNDLCSLPNSNPLPLYLPVGTGRDFHGILDILNYKKYIFISDFKKKEVSDFTEEEKGMIELYRDLIIETIKLNNKDDHVDYNFNDIDLIKKKLRELVINDKVNLVFCGSALHNKGIKLILDGIIDYLPSPEEHKNLTIKHLVKNEEKIKTIVQDKNSDFQCIRVFKVVDDPYVGNMAYARIYSGIIKKGDILYNNTRKYTERIQRLVRIYSGKRNDLNEGTSGDIVGIIGFKKTYTGDTLTDTRHKNYYFEKLDLSEPVLSATILFKNKDQLDKFVLGSKKILFEDPSLHINIDKETSETKISGMGVLHFDVFKDRMKSQYNVDIEIVKPEVSYRETITKPVYNVTGVLKKQRGGSGQYAIVKIDVLPNDTKFEFVNDIKYGTINNEFIKSIEEGAKEFMKSGWLSGNKIIGMKVRVFDGAQHPVDSSDLAFRIATNIALREAYLKASPILLEPIMRATISIPKIFLGNVISEISINRGNVIHVSEQQGLSEIKILMPLDTLNTFQPKLLSLTQGRGKVYIEGKEKYDKLPDYLSKKIMQEFEKTRYKK